MKLKKEKLALVEKVLDNEFNCFALLIFQDKLTKKERERLEDIEEEIAPLEQFIEDAKEHRAEESCCRTRAKSKKMRHLFGLY
jgi:hypothetical protein